jgi:hypothetical protein
VERRGVTWDLIIIALLTVAAILQALHLREHRRRRR